MSNTKPITVAESKYYDAALKAKYSHPFIYLLTPLAYAIQLALGR